jgi:hypothetical protein
MRCVMCGRRLQKGVIVGKFAIGPECAKKRGLIEARVRVRLEYVEHEEQLDLFDSVTQDGQHSIE